MLADCLLRELKIIYMALVLSNLTLQVQLNVAQVVYLESLQMLLDSAQALFTQPSMEIFKEP